MSSTDLLHTFSPTASRYDLPQLEGMVHAEKHVRVELGNDLCRDHHLNLFAFIVRWREFQGECCKPEVVIGFAIEAESFTRTDRGELRCGCDLLEEVI